MPTRISMVALLVSLITIAIGKPAVANIVPENINPDTLSVISLPWVRSGDSYRSTGNDMKVDADGNIYIAGHFEQWIDFGDGQRLSEGEDLTSADIFVAKYDPLGNLLWVNTAGGYSDDKGLGLAISGNNIFVTGYFSGIAYFGEKPLLTKDRQNLFLANYSRSGELKWLKQADSDGILRGQSIAADRLGNVIVTGNFRETVAFDHLSIRKKMNKNIYMVKFDSLGTAKWLRQATGGNSLITYVYVYDVECDPDNNVIISGEMMGPVKFGNISYKTRSEWYREGALPKREVFIAKYDKKGNLKWLRNTAVESNFGDMHIDSDGNLLLTGFFLGALEGKLKGQANFGKKTIHTHLDLFEDVTEDIYLAKYDKDGQFLWVRSFGGNAQDRGQGVASDPDGNIYVTGFFINRFEIDGHGLESKKYRVEAKDIFVAKFSPEGQVAWINRAGSSKNDQGTAITADNKGNIYVTGHFEGNAAFGKNWVSSKRYANFFLAKYNSVPQ